MEYECNDEVDKWSFENRGVRSWSRTPELEAYLKEHMPETTTREERTTAEEHIDSPKRPDLGSQY